VSIDTLTGEYMVERTDILHETGRSLNPCHRSRPGRGRLRPGHGLADHGRELVWDAKGRLRTHAPSTYKIPLASDRPKVFNVALADWSEAAEPTVHKSKAVGEPPFMLGMAVLHALSDAVASVADHKVCPRLDAPATPERVLMAVEQMRKEASK
jgi:xanthine dehydrogenase large subunit